MFWPRLCSETYYLCEWNSKYAVGDKSLELKREVQVEGRVGSLQYLGGT